MTSTRRPKAPGAYLRLPLWARFTLASVIAAALLVAMILFVDRHNTNAPTSTNVQAAVQANRDAEILISQDQAPRSVRLAAGVSPAVALAHAVHARMARQIAVGTIDGPLGRSRCVATSASVGSRHAYRCTVVAGSVTYPFLGVVDTSARRVTYCKRDAAPVPSESVPISRRCRA